MSSQIMQVVLRGRARAHGPMLHVCPVIGCSAITMGGTCVEHDSYGASDEDAGTEGTAPTRT